MPGNVQTKVELQQLPCRAIVKPRRQVKRLSARKNGERNVGLRANFSIDEDAIQFSVLVDDQRPREKLADDVIDHSAVGTELLLLRDIRVTWLVKRYAEPEQLLLQLTR